MSDAAPALLDEAADDVPFESQGEAALARLLRDLHADPRAHDFFAVLRRIESICADRPRWGEAARPSQEPLRFSQDAELDFAPAALSSLDLTATPVPRLGVRFFGLFGSQGPMPLHFTEHVRERLRAHGDPTTARFIDVFHHRLLTFFYRAWAQAQPTVHLDRPADERYSAWLGSSFGHHPATAREPARFAAAELFQAGLLGGRSRHPEGLRKVLNAYFGVPVAIEEHVAQWLPLEPADQSALGFARNRRERLQRPSVALGVDAVTGFKVPDRQYRFRIVLGPLTLERYEAFIPGGAAWRELRDWVDQYAGLDLRWDVRLVLARREVPPPRLDRSVRLGLTGWAGGHHLPKDRGDLRLRPLSSSLDRSRSSHA